ncbi:baseplate J/gp47 family protein [Paraburkholderia aspalathi]|uniref:Phage-related baseplate assembly protein n=1 Tax=Paraburkholderia aspalathi TaxID=1324617 RepID=A0A1I7ELB1_9BURK|nr:baseplate J/gp47 family protein [Paraburkholderia aspalathi]SFU24697.1 Phage-related baseplate assembly protein [Paraburkholderia aspalathi]
MSTTPIDLSRLPVPDIVETIDYETLLAERKAHLVSLYPAVDQKDVAATLELESEPMLILLQENAYREIVLRQRVNDAARAVMLAYSMDADLDNLAAFFDIERQIIRPADPANNIAEIREGNDDLRTRTQLAPQGFSVAGPEGAYVKHARDASGLVRDASAISPTPCNVVVTVLSRVGDGTADRALLDIVDAALSPEDVRPLGDRVVVHSAEILRYSIRATLRFFDGPSREVAFAEANKRAAVYAEQMHRLGMEITLDGVYAALRAPGVQKVNLDSPPASIPATKQQAPFCTSIELIDGGVYE